MLSEIKMVFKKALSLIRTNQPMDLGDYWKTRAKKYGKRAVLNLVHTESEFDQVTEEQKRILFPILSSLLNGSEKTILDFGCGPGRFTQDLANTIRGSAVGMDLSQELIDLAPTAINVTYHAIPDGKIPTDDFKFDVVWICLVLGGIPETVIKKTAEGIEDVLNPGGLLFLVENTSQIPDSSYWFFRSENHYQTLFPSIDLHPITSYIDVGEEISVMAGRKLLN